MKSMPGMVMKLCPDRMNNAAIGMHKVRIKFRGFPGEEKHSESAKKVN
jgi:hypothetical protein